MLSFVFLVNIIKFRRSTVVRLNAFKVFMAKN